MNIVLRALESKKNLLSLEEVMLNNKKKFIIIYNSINEHIDFSKSFCEEYYINFKKLKSKMNNAKVSFVIFEGKFYFNSAHDAVLTINIVKKQLGVLSYFDEEVFNPFRFGQRFLNLDRVLTGFTAAHASSYYMMEIINAALRPNRNNVVYSEEALRNSIPQLETQSGLTIRSPRARAIFIDETHSSFSMYPETFREGRD